MVPIARRTLVLTHTWQTQSRAARRSGRAGCTDLIDSETRRVRVAAIITIITGRDQGRIRNDQHDRDQHGGEHDDEQDRDN